MTAVHSGSSGTPVADRSHRVHWFSGRLHEVLDELTAGGLSLLELDGPTAGECVVELLRGAARLEGVALQVLAQADRVDVGAESGATSTGAWLAGAATLPHGDAHRLVKLARRLDAPFQQTADAVTAGRADTDQARVVVSAVDALPPSVGPEDRARAERHLLDEATRHDARQLKVLGKHLLHVIDPEAADAELLTRIEAEEAAAARRTHLSLFDDGNGTCHGTFRIPSLHGAMLSVALDALASPKRPDPIVRSEPSGAGDAEVDDPAARVRPTPEVRGEAFCQLLERFPTKRLPRTGGGLVTVLVTMELDRLLDGLGAATVSTGGYVSAGQVRRLACSAGIIPVVLGSKSQVLDLGRKVRLHSESQRIAMAVRDQGCTAEGCTVPAAWCHAHHRVAWSAGGRTSVRDGRLVCPKHHRMIHRPGFETEYLPSGRIRIMRRRQ